MILGLDEWLIFTDDAAFVKCTGDAFMSPDLNALLKGHGIGHLKHGKIKNCG